MGPPIFAIKVICLCDSHSELTIKQNKAKSSSISVLHGNIYRVFFLNPCKQLAKNELNRANKVLHVLSCMTLTSELTHGPCFVFFRVGTNFIHKQQLMLCYTC